VAQIFRSVLGTGFIKGVVEMSICRFQTSATMTLFLVLSTVCAQTSQKVYLGAAPGEATITQNGYAVAKLRWAANAVSGVNDTLLFTALSYQVNPRGGKPYTVPLNFPVQIQPAHVDSVTFSAGAVQLLLCNSGQTIVSSRLAFPGWPAGPAVNFMSVFAQDPGLPTYTASGGGVWVGGDSVKVNVGRVSGVQTWVLAADGLLPSAVAKTDQLPSLSQWLLLDSFQCTLGSGTKLPGTLHCKGQLIASGVQNDSVSIDTVYCYEDPLPYSQPKANMQFVHCGCIGARHCRIAIGSGSVDGLIGNDTFNIHVLNSKVSTFAMNSGRISLARCVLNLGAAKNLQKTIAEIDSCRITDTTGSSWTAYDCCMGFVGDTVRTACAINVTGTSGAFVHFSGNIFTRLGTGQNGQALVLGDKVAALVQRNIFRNFGNPVTLGSYDHVIAANNTFYNNGSASVSTGGGGDSLAIYNNIFWNTLSATAITHVDISSGSMSAWIDNNIWGTTLADNPVNSVILTGAANVAGLTACMCADPLIVDTMSMALSPASPAIDAGARAIRGFATVVPVFDTLCSLPESLHVSTYSGNGPDIGVFEVARPSPFLPGTRFMPYVTSVANRGGTVCVIGQSTGYAGVDVIDATQKTFEAKLKLLSDTSGNLTGVSSNLVYPQSVAQGDSLCLAVVYKGGTPEYLYYLYDVNYRLCAVSQDNSLNYANFWPLGKDLYCGLDGNTVRRYDATFTLKQSWTLPVGINTYYRTFLFSEPDGLHVFWISQTADSVYSLNHSMLNSDGTIGPVKQVKASASDPAALPGVDGIYPISNGFAISYEVRSNGVFPMSAAEIRLAFVDNAMNPTRSPMVVMSNLQCFVGMRYFIPMGSVYFLGWEVDPCQELDYFYRRVYDSQFQPITQIDSSRCVPKLSGGCFDTTSMYYKFDDQNLLAVYQDTNRFAYGKILPVSGLIGGTNAFIASKAAKKPMSILVHDGMLSVRNAEGVVPVIEVFTVSGRLVEKKMERQVLLRGRIPAGVYLYTVKDKADKLFLSGRILVP
jgi:hypothetical protein